ncbi:unnamed protein product [Moneuplotes crassus]|uniref:Cytochrome P450 n=1 Tax=Euplotes crassus TaxID=5936 RepID=A0AAD1UAR0_EUPCR|nr:unnamed protein product [Moneuplotes crassus]
MALEMLTNFVWLVVKYLILFLLAMAIYFGYKLFYVPLTFRRKFEKYKNVYVTEKFNPIVGDLKPSLDDINNGRAYYDNLKKLQSKMGGADMKVYIQGFQPIITFVSNKAVKEVVGLIPSVIDRADIRNNYSLKFGCIKFADGSFINCASTPDIVERRKSLFKLLGVSTSSQHIPVILKMAAQTLSKIQEEKEVKILEHTDYINLVQIQARRDIYMTNKVFMAILFGKDLDNFLTEKHDYEAPDGTIEKYSLVEYFGQVMKSYHVEGAHPATFFLPFLNKWNIINPWKRNSNNMRSLKSITREVLRRSQDKDSVWHQISQLEKFSEEDIFNDLLLIILGGGDTVSHNFVSVLYFLKKYPSTFSKLRQELEQHGFTKGCNLEKTLTMENIQKLEYLSNAIKEVLRIDAPILHIMKLGKMLRYVTFLFLKGLCSIWMLLERIMMRPNGLILMFLSQTNMILVQILRRSLKS